MTLWSYLRRHKKSDDAPYTIGGLASVFAFLIVIIFGLSVADHYLLKSGSLAAVISSVLVDLVNGDRGGNSVGGLTVNQTLTVAAQAKADHMAANGYFAHISPDGKDSWYWFRQAGYAFTYAGENLAVDFSDSIDVERAWMNSPTHRANILNGNFTEIGIATAQGTYKGRPTTFVVQMFGLPAMPAHAGQAGTPARAAAAPAPVETITLPDEPTEPALATTEPAPIVSATPTSPTAVLGTEAATAESSSRASWWQHLLASPKSMLQYAYYALAALVLLLLAYVTELEFKRHHLRHVGATTFLFVLMAGLFVLADLVFFSQPVLAQHL